MIKCLQNVDKSRVHYVIFISMSIMQASELSQKKITEKKPGTKPRGARAYIATVKHLNLYLYQNYFTFVVNKELK